MKKEAEQHAAEDAKTKEKIETKNNADSVIFQTEKILEDYKDKVAADIQTEVKEKLETLKKVKDGDDIEAIKKAMDELSKAAQKIGEAMYKESASAGSSGGQAGAGENAEAQSSEAPKEGSSTGSEQGPVEAEYEEVKK